LAVLLTPAASLRAQDIERFQPALDENGFLGLDATRTPGSLRGAAHLFGDLAFQPVKVVTVSGERVRLDERTMLHLGAELGLWGRGAVALRLPMVLQQRGLTTDETGARTHTSDVFVPADPQLLARFRFLGASMSNNDEPHDGPGMAVQVGAAFPIGKGARLAQDGMPLTGTMRSEPFTSDGSVRTDVALLGDFQLLGAGVGGMLGYRHHFWDPKSAIAGVTGASDEFTFAGAIKLPIPPVPALSGVIEVRGVTGFKSARDTSVELDIGARWNIGNFVIVLGGGFGLTDGIGTPDGRIILGVYGVLPDGDKDKDGVPDSDDQCVFLPEDRDGFQDEDGCPDPDNDNDLIPDVDDKCPNVPAEEGHDEDEDGCTDPVKK
jgi:hypothetical protein